MTNVRKIHVDWYGQHPPRFNGGPQLAYQGDHLSNMVIFDHAPELPNYYLLVEMKTDEAGPVVTLPEILLEGAYWVIPNYYTQICQKITYQVCCKTESGDFEHHSAKFEGTILPTIKHDGEPIDQSPMFDSYIDILDKRVSELILDAGVKEIDSELKSDSENPVQNRVIKAKIDEIDENAIALNGRLDDEIADVKSELNDFDEGVVALNPSKESWYRGYFNGNGQFVSNNANAAPMNSPVLMKAGTVVIIKPNGMRVQVRTYSYSDGTYTTIDNNNYTSDITLNYADATYVSINVAKTSGATLPLDEVVAELYYVSKMQKQIDNNSDEIESIKNTIGNTTMGTKATTVTGAIAEQGNSIAEVAKGINAVGYEKGSSVTIQTAENAANFVLDKPSGRMLVESTNAPIFTGTINNIDLLNVKEGVFTDSHSGVTIEVTRNEVYIHGTTTAGFRFDFQKGEFYTDSFANHPADLDILPNVDGGYRLCFAAKTGYTMPSNIYVGTLNEAGTTTKGYALSGSSAALYKNGTYIALYSNAAISNIDIKFTLGFKLKNIPGTIAGIEATAKADYGTTIIQSAGAYILGDLTWTWDSAQYEAYQLLKESSLTKDKVFVWFGDSISQLRELPNLTSALIGATVYDCSFAGAPLTYGNPTMYQPTGFMSLCSQIVAGNFSSLASALTAQEQSGVNVTEKRQHLATLQALNFNDVTDIVVLAGTNDFDNDYVNASNFVSGFSSAITTLLTAYPHLIIHVLSPIWRGDKTEGVTTIPTMEDIVNLEKTVADDFCLPFIDLYHSSGINQLTASVYLENDILHLSAKGDALMANRCAKALLSD